MGTEPIKIQENLYYLGVNDRQTEYFENMWPLPYGVAYNSYLLTGEKTCLMDTVKISKSDEFVDNVKAILKDRKLDYLVIHHIEPDHSGSIPQILDLYPDLKIVGNKKTRSMLNDYYEIDSDHFIEVGEGDELDLGDRKLTFYLTAMVHWPESMVSYDAENKILFSQDIFGGFGTNDGAIFDDELDYDLRRTEFRRYYTNIVGKYSQMAVRAINKLSSLEIETICPVHGCIWRKQPSRIVEDYTKWATYEVNEGVVIAYASMYGNTELMADQLARYLADEGVRNIEVFDVSKTHESYIISNCWEKKSLVLGSCTYNNTVYPVMSNLLNVLKMQKLKNHVVSVFGSYGWSGGAVKNLKEFVEEGNFETTETVVEAKGRMKDEDDQGLRKMAKEIAAKIK
ncbi:FprA family A-type flavoprotein [Finegoldia magna]|uniref:FprA family A-type flavoprotein n=1 Tax=Finegoldia magna TaxID=1260 RepID=UPI001D138C81|nr:FprA family A-type flavoprotein [Finegoldia magna]UEB33617.1 FprA family A-type flavoprotein [Finegoldia magna]